MEMDHSCYIPNCINPLHMKLATHQDNLNGRRLKGAHSHGKTHCWQGHEYLPANTTYSAGGSKLCRLFSRSTSKKK